MMEYYEIGEDDDRKMASIPNNNNNYNDDDCEDCGNSSDEDDKKPAALESCHDTELERRRRRLALDSVERDAERVWTTLPLHYRQSKEFILTALRSANLPAKSDFERTFEQSLRFDRDVVLAFCARNDFSKLYYSRHLYVPDCLVGDKQVMLAYCSKIPRSLQECKEELCNDREVVEAAIALDGLELQYASPRLRGDKELVTKACQKDGRALEFCPDGQVRSQLTSDRDFMLKVLSKHGGSMLRLVPERLKHDKQLLLEALAHGMRFRYVPQEYQQEKTFLGEALKRNSSLYLEMNKALQLDQELALAAITAPDSVVEIHKRVLKNCSTLQNNRHVIMAIAQRGDRDMLEQILTTSANGNNNHVNPFTSDKELMMAAIQRDCKLFKYAHATLRQDEELILASIQEQSVQDTLREISIETRRTYPSITIKAIQVSSQWRLRHIKQMIPDPHWRNRDVITAWIKRGGPILDIFERFVVNDEELALLIAKHNWIEFKKVSATLLANSDFMLKAVQQDGRVIRFGSHDIHKNFNILVHAIANHHRAFIGIHKVNINSNATATATATATTTTTATATAATAARTEGRGADNNNNGSDNSGAQNRVRSQSTVATATASSSNRREPYYHDYYDYIQRSFKPRVKELLDLQLTFVNDFLRGIATSSKSNHKLPPAKRSQLPMLDRGIETSQAFKQLIAEYLGVPVGEDLKIMRLAWHNLNYPPNNSSSSSSSSSGAAASAAGPRSLAAYHNFFHAQEQQQQQQNNDNNGDGPNNNNMLVDVAAEEEEEEIIMEDDEFMHIMGHHHHRGRYLHHHHLAPPPPPPAAAQRPPGGAEEDDDDEDDDEERQQERTFRQLHLHMQLQQQQEEQQQQNNNNMMLAAEREEEIMEMELEMNRVFRHPAALRERRRLRGGWRDRDNFRERGGWRHAPARFMEREFREREIEREIARDMARDRHLRRREHLHFERERQQRLRERDQEFFADAAAAAAAPRPAELQAAAAEAEVVAGAPMELDNGPVIRMIDLSADDGDNDDDSDNINMNDNNDNN